MYTVSLAVAPASVTIAVERALRKVEFIETAIVAFWWLEYSDSWVYGEVACHQAHGSTGGKIYEQVVDA